MGQLKPILVGIAGMGVLGVVAAIVIPLVVISVRDRGEGELAPRPTSTPVIQGARPRQASPSLPGAGPATPETTATPVPSAPTATVSSATPAPTSDAAPTSTPPPTTPSVSTEMDHPPPTPTLTGIVTQVPATSPTPTTLPSTICPLPTEQGGAT